MKIRPISRRHLRDEVYQALWQMIVQGKVAPNALIVEEEVAGLLGVSRTPVREALRRLEYEGLVSLGLNGRPRVTPPTTRDVDEIYTLISTLEGLAARLAAPHLTDDDLAMMDRIVEQMTERGRRGEVERLMEIDEQFHHLLYERSQNKRLQRMVHELRRQMERFEFVFFSTPSHLEASMDRHRNLVRVLAKRDAVMAQRTVEANWDVGRVALLEISRQTSEASAAAGILKENAG